MKTVVIYRSDFNDSKDSKDTEYFDYILTQLGIPIHEQSSISEIFLDVKSYTVD